MKITSLASALLAAVLGVTVAACGKKETPPPPPAAAPAPAPAPKAPEVVPVSVKSVTLGNALGEGKKVAAALATFAPKDTIYAVVETAGTGKATLKAVWTFKKGDKTATVSDTTQDVDATGPANTAFEIKKPDGWPAGDYQVEVFLNGASAGVQKFNVK